jgi:hypothetical protein
MAKEIVVTVAPDGKVTVKVQGVPGKECLDFSKFIEDGLVKDPSAVKREYTGEFYQQSQKGNVRQKLTP